MAIPGTRPQAFENGQVHHWYRIALGYSDHLVSDLLAELTLDEGGTVLDPFCGSGTTAVEAMKKGISCWCVDANPVACFATRVKTNWHLDADKIEAQCTRIVRRQQTLRGDVSNLRRDLTYQYLKKAGMLERGWISPSALYDIIAIKIAIRASSAPQEYKDFFLLAAANELVRSASNVRFGPELYCGKPRKMDVLQAFRDKVSAMREDIQKAAQVMQGDVRVLLGDSRECSSQWLHPPGHGFSGVICSPPYPTEHDYTRNSRLELAFLEAVVDRDSLRAIKKTMIRSHTKGIYIEDCDSTHVESFGMVQKLADTIEVLAVKKTYGFARLYGRVVKEYFGGMYRHFKSVLPLLEPGAKCAYVVGDQASYFQVPISTADILGEIAEAAGFQRIGVRKWRQRWATGSQRYLDENILLLQKPHKQE